MNSSAAIQAPPGSLSSDSGVKKGKIHGAPESDQDSVVRDHPHDGAEHHHVTDEYLEVEVGAGGENKVISDVVVANCPAHPGGRSDVPEHDLPEDVKWAVARAFECSAPGHGADGVPEVNVVQRDEPVALRVAHVEPVLRGNREGSEDVVQKLGEQGREGLDAAEDVQVASFSSSSLLFLLLAAPLAAALRALASPTVRSLVWQAPHVEGWGHQQQKPASGLSVISGSERALDAGGGVAGWGACAAGTAGGGAAPSAAPAVSAEATATPSNNVARRSCKPPG
eukprot:CAMPEP_0195114870 /NCGR_PEP_ID=MMETSP0448-20130528/107226_1 /TAXON_ID=66468 /ORGANISM="Heterocapsa triquestra, Strain CCMP 448" /LENGTH=281 /DNA_ID=CAMNT_0040151937 /DNA_START=571 /DNA_END=1413 /DNA_ORIENTATION=+